MRICPKCSQDFQGPGWRCPGCGHEPTMADGVRLLAGNDWREAMDFPDSHEMLSEVEGNSFWFRHRRRVIIQAVQRHFPRAGNFLEVGCGNGHVLKGLAQHFASMPCVGLDLGLEGLLRARQGLPGVEGVELVQADARCLPYREEFDLAGAFDVLEHLEDDRLIIAKLHQALRQGGGLILTVPQHQWLWSSFDELARHKRRYNRSGLREKLERQGFSLVWMGSFMSLVLPAVLASRLKWLLVREEATLERIRSDLDLGPRLDAILYGICGLEHLCLSRGLALPFGTSMLCLARKE